MAGYIIAEVQVTDPERYEEYRRQVEGTIAAYGGRYKVRGGKSEALEGDAPRGRLVVLEFDSYEQAKAWYDSRSTPGRRRSVRTPRSGRVILVDGYDLSLRRADPMPTSQWVSTPPYLRSTMVVASQRACAARAALATSGERARW